MPSSDSGERPLPIRSMTGYALVRAQTAAGELTLSLRSVNHRGLDLHFHQSSVLAPFESAMRSLLKRHIGRGHVEIRTSLCEDSGTAMTAYNRDLLASYLGVFRQACEEFELDNEPDLNVFFSFPGVLDSAHQPRVQGEAFESQVMAALNGCIDELNASREREAQEIHKGLEDEIRAIEEIALRLRAIRAEAVPYLLRRLRERLTDLLQEANISEARLVEEAALLADKSDVEEEITRLEVHTQELRRIFEKGGEIGKRLDFLLQEMNRETNTILSKTSGISDIGLTMTNLALETKAKIERIREQALNFE